MILEIFTIFVGGLIFLVAYWYYTYLWYNKHLKKIDGPTPIPLIGNALEFGDSDTFLPIQQKLTEKYNGIVKIMMGFEFILIVTDYKMLEFFLSSTKIIEKSRSYRYMHKWLGFGLLTSKGRKWKQRRRMITPAYHFNILEQFIEVFDKNGVILLEKIKKEVGKKSTDIYPYVTLCALDIICETAMGTSVNAQINEDSKYVKCVKTMCRIITDRAFHPSQQTELTYRFNKNYRKEEEAIGVLHNYTLSVIRNRRDALVNKQENKKVDTDDIGAKKRVAFLDMLLQSTIEGQPLSDEDIREEVDTFMFEGHDTTASAMSFALYFLANNPDAQEKVIEEQKSIFGDEPNRSTSYSDLTEMKYLEMCIKETLRLCPSVPFFARECAEDVKYSDDIIIKKGTTIDMFVYGMHMNEKYFPEPEKFDPDRFLPENFDGKLPYSFLPFSAGLRNCIGQKFAMLEMKCTVSKVIRNYKLHAVVPHHKILLRAETILKSGNGVFVGIENRQW